MLSSFKNTQVELFGQQKEHHTYSPTHAKRTKPQVLHNGALKYGYTGKVLYCTVYTATVGKNARKSLKQLFQTVTAGNRNRDFPIPKTSALATASWNLVA